MIRLSLLVGATMAKTYEMREGNCRRPTGNSLGKSQVFEEKEFADRSVCMKQCDENVQCRSFVFDLFSF